MTATFYRFCFTFLLLLLPLSIQAQTADEWQLMSAEERLSVQRQLFPQEKIYVCTDAETYLPGDTLWFRGWVVDAITYQHPSSDTGFLYVELHDSSKKKIARVRVRCTEGDIFAGQIVLPETLPTGRYTLFAYTCFSVSLPEALRFRRPIHVVSHEDFASGLTPLKLQRPDRPNADTLSAVGTTIHRGGFEPDTLSVFNLHVPANTWYAVSVIDDQLTPIDTARTIDRQLSHVPDLFDLQSVSEADGVVLSSNIIEDKGFLMGLCEKLTNGEIRAINMKTGKLYAADVAENGYFIIPDVDIAEGETFLLFPVLKDVVVDLPLELYTLNSPKKLSHFTDDINRYFVQGPTRNIVTDTLQQSDNTLPVKAKNNKKELELSEYYEPDDIYTRLATHTIYAYLFEDKESKRKVSYQSCKFPGVQVINGVTMCSSDNGKLVPVNFVINDKPLPQYYDSLGNALPQAALLYPLDVVYAMDFIPADVVSKNARGLTVPNPEAPIIRLDLYKADQIPSGTPNYYKPLGYQRTMWFPTFRVRRDRWLHTRFWNPAMRSDTEGNLRLELPLPQNIKTSYTIRLEGITPEGKMITYLARVITD